MSHDKTKTIRYRLYAAVTDQSTVKAAFEAPYSRINGRYALIYKRGKAPTGYKEITDKIEALLAESDRQWIQETNARIMAQFVSEHKEAQHMGIMDFAKRFEKELEAEREKMEDEEHGTD